jgi:ankyrin repeat protein
MKRLAMIVLSGLAVAALPASQAAVVTPVVDAAEDGDLDGLRRLLRAGADVNETQGDGRTALHFAADEGNLELVELLLAAGANVHAGTRIGGYTALHMASRNGHADVVRALLEAHADPEVMTTNSGVQPLHLAAASASPEAVRLLLAAGADPNARAGKWEQTPLVFAAAENRVENIRLLLDAGADPNLTSAVIDTVEMEKGDRAADKRIVQVLKEFKRLAGGGPEWQPDPSQVQAAIALGREVQRKWPNVPDPACDTPAGPDNDSREDEAPPAHCVDATAAEGGTEAATEEKKPEEPRPPTYGEQVGAWGGLTPLHHAVRQGHREAALALLEGGADIDQPTAGDHTSPLLMAALNGQFDLALTLIERGADPNLASTAGTTPLFAVIERQWAPWAHYAHPVDYQKQQATHLEVMRALLEAGANPNVRLAKHLWYSEYTTQVFVPAGLHYDGATPFWRAAQALDVEAMKLLRAYGADPFIPTRKMPTRKRQMRDPQPGEEEKEIDHSGLPPVPVGGPWIYPVHAAAGAGYGQYFMAHAHRHVPDNWLNAVKYLVEECGADVNARDGNGYTPLHHAASRGDNELIRYLIDKGADVMAVSRAGQTTADMANGPAERIAPFPATIELLVSLGAVNNGKCVSC